jgi:hypothetical protein
MTHLRDTQQTEAFQFALIDKVVFISKLGHPESILLQSTKFSVDGAVIDHDGVLGSLLNFWDVPLTSIDSYLETADLLLALVTLYVDWVNAVTDLVYLVAAHGTLVNSFDLFIDKTF